MNLVKLARTQVNAGLYTDPFVSLLRLFILPLAEKYRVMQACSEDL